MQSCWLRKGQFLSVPDTHPWWRSHAQIPTVLPIHDRLWRLYVAGRDANNRGASVRIDLDPSNDMKVLSIAPQPCLRVGPAGAFDQDASGVTCAAPDGDKVVFGTSGLRQLTATPYELGIGLAHSLDDGETIEKSGQAPVLAAGSTNPAGCGIPQVIRMGSQWHMWFSSLREWTFPSDTDPELRYDIRHAVSDDLARWREDTTPAIALAGPHEGGHMRPWVQQTSDGFEMWYCTRGRYDASDPSLRAYKIGYATSTDGRAWTRRDTAHAYANPPQQGDWDHDMQCYPSIIRHNGTSYMFYCGNEYGRHGVGYAVRQEGDC
ncbi:hypothetical protein [Shimia sp. Alg240-R146]|uniref:hypothetical protein n=1 Tax=Shimia sp. Alg240-R146 TaxID=2993449 RepID=UPI0022E472E9|nr:hypothetical protein [Shimia sp. Alg240-R146]